jgi:hypothetical protein
VAPALQLPWQHAHHMAAAGRLSTVSTAQQQQQQQPHLAHMQQASRVPTPPAAGNTSSR